MKTVYSYVTNRALNGVDGKKDGKIRVAVLKGSATASVDYICPSCSHSESTKKLWAKPFSVKCSGCGFLIRVVNIKREFKRELKAAKKPV